MLAPAETHLHDARVRRDPTRTWKLRAKMRAEGDRRWQLLAQTLRQALIEHDLVGLRGMSRLPYGDKTEGFGLWLAEELRQKVLGFDGGWLRPYVREAANLAQRHAAEMAAPFAVVDPSRVAAMQSLAVSELRGIVAAAQQQIVRAIAHCLSSSSTPHCAANAVSSVVRAMRNRTRAMADYIVVKTHATSTLSALRSVGVTHVGTVAERLRPRTRQTVHGRVLLDKRRPIEEGEDVDVVTAGDDDVCTVCEEISDGGPYELDEAEGLIPAHAFCRCGFVPLSDARFANVREFDARWFDRDVSEQPRAASAPGHSTGEWATEGGWSGEPLKGSQGDPGLVSTALASATGRSKAQREEAKAEAFNYHRIDVAQLEKDPALFEGSVDTFRNGDLFPYMRASDFNGDAKHDARAVIDRIKSNLYVMWNDTTQASRDLWRHWYEGAHDLITERMKQYPGVGRAAMTAVYAAQSPNTVWDVNVHLGDRLLDTVFNHGGDKWDKGMADAAQGQLERAEKAVAKAKDQARVQKNIEGLKKTFREVKRAGSYDAQVDDYHRAAWIKLWNDAHDNSSVREVGIDGKLGKPIKNKGMSAEEAAELPDELQDEVYDFDPNQARDPQGRWTATGGGAGYEFVSPATGQGGQLPDALAGLRSNRQRILREASEDIDAQLSIVANHANAVGAWSDGAENSIVTTIEHDANWDKLRVAAAMEGHIADQKAVLVFKQQDGGTSALYSFHVGESDITKLHENLLADGLAFHTIAPYSGGARVYVADLDGTAHDAVARAAERYDAGVDYQLGRAEFIGTVKQDGTDREQRDDARRAYEKVIEQSPVSRSQAIWSRVHNHWGKTLSVVSDAFNPDEPRDPQGKWTAEPASFEGSSAAMGEATPTPYTREVDALRDKSIPISWQQRQMLDMYTGGYKDAFQGAEADRLDGLIKQFTMPRDIVLYRRVGWSRWNDKLAAHVGKDFTDPEFMSTTLTPELKLKEGSLMEIHVPKGAAALPVGSLSSYPEEAEVLFPRGSRMRIESATQMSTGPKDMKFVAKLYAS